MRIKRYLKQSPRNILLIFLLFVIIWNEYLALKLRSLFWITPVESGKHYSILIVSDPQLIGYRNEKFGGIARWDSDRYLKSGFEAAVASAQPQMILFLGDLFDEGVIMSSQEFEWTLERFTNIFSHVNNIPTIYLPGDNDIGGENEPIYDRLVSRFNRIFVHSLNKLDHFSQSHVDIAATIPLEDGKFKSIIQANNPRVKILLSHIPLLRSLRRADYETVESYSPDLILTAHDHTAELYLRNRTTPNFQRYAFKKRLDFLISSNHPIIEIQNPTVSYRMGVPNMGYGILTFYDESPLAAVYTVFWLPGRYPQLYLYIFAIIVVVCFILIRWIVFSSEKLMGLTNSRKKKNIV
uniref:Calcineurin-like phosphoesterase domain-containing protein n=1 Tax=Panagrolaimus superbus TaxID=310955 RepID=A0A914Z104_9BILA